jgi:uncharacterized membrane protein
MRYIETETQEPTYNNFQIIAGSITAVAAVLVFAFGVISLISSL